MTDADPQPHELIEEIETDDDTTELAEHLVTTIEVLADEIDAADTPDGGGGMAGMMDPGMALSILVPLVRRWAIESPDGVMAVLARTHLETGALIEHHRPEAEPIDLVE